MNACTYNGGVQLRTVSGGCFKCKHGGAWKTAHSTAALLIIVEFHLEQSSVRSRHTPPSPAHSWDCRVHVLTAEQVRSKTKSQIATWAAPKVVLFFFSFLYFRGLEWIFWGKLSMLFHLDQPESGTILIWKGLWSGWLRAIGETLLEEPYCILLHCCQLSNEESETVD